MIPVLPLQAKFLFTSANEILSRDIHLKIAECLLNAGQLRCLVEWSPEQLMHFFSALKGMFSLSLLERSCSLEHVKYLSLFLHIVVTWPIHPHLKRSFTAGMYGKTKTLNLQISNEPGRVCLPLNSSEFQADSLRVYPRTCDPFSLVGRYLLL